MATQDATSGAHGADLAGRGNQGAVRRTAQRLATETKSFFKTSEFWTYILMVLLILIAGNSVEGNEGGTDYFAADKVWLYITILTFGYLLSRGIAKSGSKDPYWSERGDRNADH